jgi:flagellar basal body L-ring protein FlgH
VDFLDLLRERLSGLLAERSGLDEQFEAILAAAAAEQRSNLNDAEEAEIAALRERRSTLEADIAATEQRVADIQRTREDQAAAADKIKRFNIAPVSTSKDGVRGSDHTLDELLWATSEEVRAGTLDNIGNVVPHLNARAAVLVTDVLPNGNLVIEGVRRVVSSGETQHVILHGLVRADDVSSVNTVFSSNIADARVEFINEGSLTDAQKKGWLTKLYEKLRPY